MSLTNLAKIAAVSAVVFVVMSKYGDRLPVVGK